MVGVGLFVFSILGYLRVTLASDKMKRRGSPTIFGFLSCGGVEQDFYIGGLSREFFSFPLGRAPEVMNGGIWWYPLINGP